jgi:hypothetical protein
MKVRKIWKTNLLNLASVASCCTWSAPAGTTSFVGTGAVFSEKYGRLPAERLQATHQCHAAEEPVQIGTEKG